MMKMIVTLTLTALLAVGCGGSNTEVNATGGPAMTTISGELTYLPRIALIPGGSATITVSDVSRQDVAAPVIAEVVIELEAQQIPIPFTLTVDRSDLDAGATFAIGATIHDRDGRLTWTTDTVNTVDLNQPEVAVGQLRLTQVNEAPTTNTDQPSLVGEWMVTTIDGAPTNAPAPTLVFGDDAMLGGNASCNSYSVGYTVDGGSISLTGEIAATLMACDPASNRQEQAFFAALADVVAFEIDESGAMVILTSPSGASIEATR